MHSDIVLPMSEKTFEASQHLCSAAVSSAGKSNVNLILVLCKRENSEVDIKFMVENRVGREFGKLTEVIIRLIQ